MFTARPQSVHFPSRFFERSRTRYFRKKITETVKISESNFSEPELRSQIYRKLLTRVLADTDVVASMIF